MKIKALKPDSVESWKFQDHLAKRRWWYSCMFSISRVGFFLHFLGVTYSHSVLTILHSSWMGHIFSRLYSNTRPNLSLMTFYSCYDSLISLVSRLSASLLSLLIRSNKTFLTYRNSEFSTLSTVTWHLCCLLVWIG